MNIKTIIHLVDNYSMEQLSKAEESIINEESPAIEVEGKDEGEMLTHVLAAQWCKEEMEQSKCDVRTAIRLYSQKVRNSIS